MRLSQWSLRAAAFVIAAIVSSATFAACPQSPPEGQTACPPPKGGGGGGLGPPTAQQGGSQTAGVIAGRVAQAVGGIVGSAGGGGPRGPGGAPGGIGGPGGGTGGGTGGGGSQQQQSPTGPTSSLESESGDIGMAAGSAAPKWGVWVSGSNSWLGGDQVNNDYFARIQTGLIGADVTLDGTYVLGLSAGVEKDWTRIKYSGVAITGKAYTISPYAAYIINQYFYADASFGVTKADYFEESQTQNGDYDGRRWFAGANLNAGQAFGNWYASTNVGYLYSAETQSSYRTSSGSDVSESKSRTGQVRSTSKLGYTELTSWGWLFPYASVRLEYDANKTAAVAIDTAGTMAANSRFGTTFGLGSSIGIGSNTTLTLEGTSTEFRSHTDIYGLSGTARITF